MDPADWQAFLLYKRCQATGQCQAGQQQQQVQLTPAQQAAEDRRKKMADLEWNARNATPDANNVKQGEPQKESGTQELKPENAFDDLAKDHPPEPPQAERQDQRNEQVDDSWDKASGPTYLVPAGVTPIYARLINSISGDSKGIWIAWVVEAVKNWDKTKTLIPKGTYLTGRYDRAEESGQERLLLWTNMLMMPDAWRTHFPVADTLDQSGIEGLRDKVNHHYLQLFLTTIAASATSAGATFGSSGGYGFSPADALRIGFSEGTSQAGQQIFSRFANRRPSILIRAGQEMTVFLPIDLHLPEWGKHDVQKL
jgi:type IV secretion system protein VirB10